MNVFLKSFIFLLVFSILHFGYDITGWAFLTPFCGVNESVFQHLKMAFWSYLLLTLVIEYPIVRRRFGRGDLDKGTIGIGNFWYSRFQSLVMLPWVMLIVWYLLPALYGKPESLWVDLIWAIAITYLSCLFVGYLEKDVEKTEFNLSTKYILLFLVFVSAFLFVWFTYKLPWVDLFENPEGL